MKTTCYCCKIQEADSDILYGVPVCDACHSGLCLVRPIGIKPSKETVDWYRDTMFANADRIRNAYDKLGIKWDDPRKAI